MNDNERIMVKIEGGNTGVSIRTFSRSFHAPHSFYLRWKDLEKLKKEKYVIAKDILTFAELRYFENMDEGQGHKIRIDIVFWWISSISDDKYEVHREKVCIPYEAFESMEDQPGLEKKVLSDSMRRTLRFEFKSRKNLKEVISRPKLKHKFVKLLETGMCWKNYERIVLYDDFVPYSFLFIGYTPYGLGLCGGIILHGQENMQTAYYKIHT